MDKEQIERQIDDEAWFVLAGYSSQRRDLYVVIPRTPNLTEIVALPLDEIDLGGEG